MIQRALLFALAAGICISAAPLNDERLQQYFESEVRRIKSGSFEGLKSKSAWEEARPRLQRELREMLSLEPLPERTDLRPVITGTVEREGIVVEKLHFQSSPGLYVTANLYRPAKTKGRIPAILYLCGHGQVKTNGVSYGNKVAYQHHGAWFARNGYVCLMLDTIQLGEIEGLHHGTNREGMWWWNSRGYTPAGVEAWNSMRALDYLETRPEVDSTRIGVTGRSGGGAYSWWIAALDQRLKVAAPVAGITDLRNHVVDGVVEGHCDCMYVVNTYRWDYPLVAALVAPRPLLIANSDKDSIFPLDGVIRTHSAVQKIYEMLGVQKNLGLLITEGPHKDTQDLQLPVFRWFNRHLKGEDPVIEMAATKLFTAEELKVFATLPQEEITSRVHETFVSKFEPQKEQSGARFTARMTELRALLADKVFHGWPENEMPPQETTRELSTGWKEVSFNSEQHIRLKLFYNAAAAHTNVHSFIVRTAEPTLEELSSNSGRTILVVRGGPDADDNSRTAIHTRRRYMLLGQTLETMRVWDIIQGVKLFRRVHEGTGSVIYSGEGKQAENLLLAAFMLSGDGVNLSGLNGNWSEPRHEPDHLNLLRFTSWDELRSMSTPPWTIPAAEIPFRTKK